ncbi:DUF4389 domain-containing protein [Arthrobacter sp. Marseille-P9274]|uniref:DUF4389 domain-containing protein n=1 Tax=Arthrobacter sp. Marseille-P9274 TaxID=2866572 RepID=UPI0021C6A533|nr:DUF4389 domain-containing protein [Arthrobacter sp. Marseille-P9274]
MKPGHIIMLVLGILFSLVGLALAGGAAFTGAVQAAQDNEGYLVSDHSRFTADSHALVSEPLEVLLDQELPPGVEANDTFGVLLRARAASAGREIFIGIAPTAQVDGYLAGVAHSVVNDVGLDPFDPDYRQVPGTQTPGPPGEQDFWAVSASGTGRQQIHWDLQSGDWTVVVMNADGSRPVSADLAAGVRLGFLGPLTIGLLITGLVLLVIGLPLLILGAAGLGRHLPPGPANRPAYPDHPPTYPAAAAGPPGATYWSGPPPPGSGSSVSTRPGSPYPALLYGELDPGVSRWMWLVKWLLAIPHYILLFFLWFAFGVVTIVAGFAILFTGRYPHSLFQFCVGVARWNWRVAFYAYGALGTDRYPPFTLAPLASYPAEFDVAYPHRLSNGLVLVKWWLLAIPHYLVIAALTGSAYTWWAAGDDWGEYVRVSGPSLLGLLVLIAAVILLFSGIYRRPLFDLILGINRWVYRVLAYAALMRDEYPPFRLDQGPVDPLAPAAAPGPTPPPGMGPDHRT